MTKIRRITAALRQGYGVVNTPKTYTSISLRKIARPPSAALQPARTPDMQYLPLSCCTTSPFRPPMFQRANAPHYFHPHKAYKNKPPESHLPQLSQSHGKKTTTIMKTEIKKKPILQLCEQTQRTPLPPAKGLRHLLHRRRLAAPLRKTQGTPETASQAK